MGKAGDVSSGFSVHQALELDGVFYGEFMFGSQLWRAGSLRADWQATLESLAMPPAETDLAELARESIWIGRADVPPQPACVMCCGLGSVWPGMGRELYANFPVARQAMDYVASLADWDLLGLMDETDLDRISQSRWQIPYLFMLEYAQWRQFSALGIRPRVVCGHSLGELIALCVAGVYDVRSAWLLLETRARHMAQLEANADKQGGMLMVPAPQDVIAEVLEQWPGIKISNRNTNRQFILGGMRDQLLEARRYLRRRRIPAILLNMDLAFHNPAMRILRDTSVMRLNGLEMQAPSADIHLLSCVTGNAYSQKRADICEAIADLDENTVDWVKLIGNVLADYAVTTFLELGPQGTLCGITSELAPEAAVIPSDQKRHEAQAMREACARLYARGQLANNMIRRCQRRASLLGQIAPVYAPRQESPALDKMAGIDPFARETLLELLAEAAGRPVEDITPDLDLQRDLGLRSSSFPFLMLEAERRLKRQLKLENLFQLITVADLLHFLAGGDLPESAAEQRSRKEFECARAPITRYVPDQNFDLVEAPINPDRPPSDPGPLLMALYDRELAPRLLAGVAARGWGLGAPALAFSCQDRGWRDWRPRHWRTLAGWPQLKRMPARIATAARPRQTVVLNPPPIILAGAIPGSDPLLEESLRLLGQKGARVLLLQRFIIPSGTLWREAVRNWFGWLGRVAPEVRTLAWLAPEAAGRNLETGDMLAWEIGHGHCERVVWSSLPDHGRPARFCGAAGCYRQIWPAPVRGEEASVFYGSCQFSRFAEPALAEHGQGALFSPLLVQENFFARSPWLPLSPMLAAMGAAATVNSPWLAIRGIQEVRVAGFPALPEGVTREGALRASARIELPLAERMIRLCDTRLEVAALTASGRKSGAWLPVISCGYLLGRESGPSGLNGLWAMQTGALVNVEPAIFYEIMGFGPQWQFLKTLKVGRGCEAALDISCQPLPEKPAERIYRLVDCALQGALATVAGQNQSQARLGEWQFGGIGYMDFDLAMAEQSSYRHLRLHLSSAWHSERLIRYHGIIETAAGHTLLAVHNLEFVHIPVARQDAHQEKA